LWTGVEEHLISKNALSVQFLKISDLQRILKNSDLQFAFLWSVASSNSWIERLGNLFNFVEKYAIWDAAKTKEVT